MKTKISISIDRETLADVEQALENDEFRNKSHLIEIATRSYLKELRHVRNTKP